MPNYSKRFFIEYPYYNIGSYLEKRVERVAAKLKRKFGFLETQRAIEEILEIESPKDYCLRLIMKMGHWLTTVRKIELLSLKADFYQDDNGKVYLTYVSECIVRPRAHKMDGELRHDEKMRKE